MSTFGSSNNDICFGCAATNTICQIAQKKFTPHSITNIERRSNEMNSDLYFMSNFENAIEHLRCGNLWDYNRYAERLNIAKIKYKINNQERLPILGNYFEKSELESYIRLANKQ